MDLAVFWSLPPALTRGARSGARAPLSPGTPRQRPAGPPEEAATQSEPFPAAPTQPDGVGRRPPDQLCPENEPRIRPRSPAPTWTLPGLETFPSGAFPWGSFPRL